MIDVFGLAYPCVDFLIQLREFPDRDGSSPIDNYSLQGGGKVATALVTLASLGKEVSVIGKTGDDSLGRFIRDDFIRHDVDIDYFHMVSGISSPFSVVLSDLQTHSRSILWEKGEQVSLEDIIPEFQKLKQARYLHMADANVQTIELAKKAQDVDNLNIFYDGDYWDEKTIQILPYVDILVTSENFAREYNKQNHSPLDFSKICKDLYTEGPDITVITLGKEGAIAYDGSKHYSHSAFDIDTVDTTGAGDVYHGAFIFGLLEQMKLPKIMEFSAAVAALQTKALGGRAAIPSLEDTKRFMESSQPRITGLEEKIEFYKNSFLNYKKELEQ